MERLLVVDDDDVFRNRLVRALTERGLQVVAAANGDEALRVARSQKPSHALVDLRMPGMQGLELVRALKAALPPVVVVVLTGYGSIATAVEALRAGALDYVTKPADADQILAAFKLGHALEAESAAENAEVPSLARVEWEHIQRVLNDCGGNISEAARRLGLHRRSLQRKLAKYPPNR